MADPTPTPAAELRERCIVKMMACEEWREFWRIGNPASLVGAIYAAVMKEIERTHAIVPLDRRPRWTLGLRDCPSCGGVGHQPGQRAPCYKCGGLGFDDDDDAKVSAPPVTTTGGR